jgi:glycosyltransferase involved in cell wall biosynthesis
MLIETDLHKEDRWRELRRLSVVVPCYNEEAVIIETSRRLDAVLSGIRNSELEIIYVDDGSQEEPSACSKCCNERIRGYA